MKKILIFILVFAASTAMFSSFFNSCEKEDCLNADGSADELTIEGSLFDPKTMISIMGFNPQEGRSTFYNQGDIIEIYEVNGTY